MFLGVLSRHVHPITWRVQRGVGATCLTAVRRSPRRFEPKEMVVAPPEIRWKNEQVENISYIRCVHTRDPDPGM